MEMKGPRKVLMVRFSAIGDILFALPALTALRQFFPHAEISWLVEDRASDVLAGHPDLHKVYVFPRKKWQKGIMNPFTFFTTVREAFSFVKILRQEPFDVIIDFQGNLKSGFFLLLSRGRQKIGLARGYCKEFNFLFTNKRVTPKSWPLYRVERDLALLAPLGVPAGEYSVRIPLSVEEEKFGEDFVKNLAPERALRIILHPGTSSFGEFKRWPLEKFAEIGRRAVDELSTQVIITWGPGEEKTAQRVNSLMEGRGVMAPETPSLKKLASVLKQVQCFVSGDTGPLHLAAMLGVPVVGLYGPKNPEIYGPHTKKKIIIWKALPCSPCTKRSCSHPICMERISTEEVFSAVKDILLRSGRFLNASTEKGRSYTP